MRIYTHTQQINYPSVIRNSKSKLPPLKNNPKVEKSKKKITSLDV